jgi:hypothetical protein
MFMQPTHSRKALETAYQQAIKYLETLEERSVAATVDITTLRERLKKPLLDESLLPEQVVSELVKDVEGGLLGSAGGRLPGSSAAPYPLRSPPTGYAVPGIRMPPSTPVPPPQPLSKRLRQNG